MIWDLLKEIEKIAGCYITGDPVVLGIIYPDDPKDDIYWIENDGAVYRFEGKII